MSRGSFLHAVSVIAAAWLVFVGHTCGAGAPLKENAHVGEVAPSPQVRIGLTRCLRDASAKIAVCRCSRRWPTSTTVPVPPIRRVCTRRSVTLKD